MNNKYLICVVGPTAVGKTQLAIDLAQAFKTEIFSADSRQFYKELSIGTAKPTLEEQKAAKHHFIDNVSVQVEYNASDFEKDLIPQLDQFYTSHSTAILCGGSGLYVDAVIKGFDEEMPTADPKIRAALHKRLEEEGIQALQFQLKELDSVFYEEVDLHNSKRLLRALEVCLISGKPYSTLRKGKSKARNFIPLQIGLEMDRTALYERINRRVDKMMEEGLLQEVKSVMEYRNQNALKTVGYRELFDYLDHKKSLEEAVEKIKVNSRRYAKRQLTWFKKDLSIQWYSPEQKAQIIEYIRNRIASLEQN